MDYNEFIGRKLQAPQSTGIPGRVGDKYNLFPHQRDLVTWAANRGRAAIFADTGLGKSRMQLSWSDAVVRHTGGKVLILAPLAVAQQTVDEGRAVGIDVTLCREAQDVRDGINITNYDRLHKFDASLFDGVVLDESSCIKHHATKTLNALMDAFQDTRFRLCATATPAPNDWTELGTHAEFLGVCSRVEMLAEYFTHDGGDTSVWRLKGHARELFWQWVCTWGALVRRPSDLGHDDGAYILPPLTVQEHIVDTDMPANGMLFAGEAVTLSDRRSARKRSLEDRVKACADIVNATDENWLVWCDLNAEGDLLAKSIPGAVQISGSDDVDTKERLLAQFATGQARILISKPSICGFGLNFQHCRNMAFVGVTDSFESYYQAVRRCWRFGQKQEVRVHVFASKSEGAVVANLKRKERDAMAMAESLSRETKGAVMRQVTGAVRHTNHYSSAVGCDMPSWLTGEA